jgi:DtxR family transcriptional regulator, Mn-dependent transcriptional regulator
VTERTTRRTEEQSGARPGGLPAAAVPDASSVATLPAPSADTLEHAATEVLEILLENDEARLATSPTELEHRLPLGARVIAGAVELLVTRGIASSRDGLVTLTEQGRVEATRRVRRHRLTARLLSDVIGLEWWKVHGRTTSWEALVDDEMEARIVELLGDPGTCPHGNPIPGSANQPHYADAMLLDDAPVGPVRVVRITQTLVADDEALQLVQLCGFIPGSEVEIKSRRDGWVEVAGTVHDAAFPPHMARHIVVAPR